MEEMAFVVVIVVVVLVALDVLLQLIVSRPTVKMDPSRTSTTDNNNQFKFNDDNNIHESNISIQ